MSEEIKCWEFTGNNYPFVYQNENGRYYSIEVKWDNLKVKADDEGSNGTMCVWSFGKDEAEALYNSAKYVLDKGLYIYGLSFNH